MSVAVFQQFWEMNTVYINSFAKTHFKCIYAVLLQICECCQSRVFWANLLGQKCCLCYIFLFFSTMSWTNYKSGNFQIIRPSGELVTFKVVGWPEEVDKCKMETWLQSGKEFWKIFQEWTKMVPNIIEWHFWKSESEKVMVDSRIVVERRPSGVAHPTIGQFFTFVSFAFQPLSIFSGLFQELSEVHNF